MKTILVDDESVAIRQFEQECAGVTELEMVGTFYNAEEALAFAKKQTIEVALMDIVLPGMNGIELGCELKKIQPNIIIVFVTGHSRYIVDALRIKADYCIMKPYDREDIYDVMKRAKLLSRRFEKRMQIVTFGRFEVYVDGCAIHFGNSKARELFALCVDREGANVSMEEAIDVLWPERSYDERVKRLYRKAVNALQSTLESVELADVFTNNRGICRIVWDKVDCDLEYFLREHALLPQQQELLQRQGYMADYSWAEMRNSRLLAFLPENDEKYL